MSSKRVIGNVEVLGDLVINGKYAMRTFNDKEPDPNTGIIDYPYYTREEVQEILDMLPVSRIGEMDYLPLNISGSFSGATSYSNVLKVQPTILEDDGTFVIIRAGTNGSSYNFYYAYVRNIRNIHNLQQSDIVQTNTPYRPSFFTNTQNILEFYGTNGYELLWYKTEDAGVQKYIITLTNGSFNEVGHQSTVMDISAFPNFSPCYAHVVKDLVYMWGYDSTLGAGRALKLYTLPVNSIRAESTAGFTQVTGFNGQTIRGVSYSNSETARIYDIYAGTSDTGKELFVYTGETSGPEDHSYTITNALAFSNSQGTKIRFAMFPSYRYGSSFNFSNVRSYAISMVYDISTKSFTYDTSSRNPISLNAVLNNNVVTFNETNPYIANSYQWRGFNETLGNVGTICQANDGFMVSTRSRWPSDASFGISKSNINNFVSQFDSINMNNRSINNNSQLRATPTYGSAVGENLMGIRFISKDRIILACSGTYDEKTISEYSNTVVADVGTSTDFTYKSLTQGTLTGYAPQTYRKFANNENYKLSGLITLVDENGNVTCHGSSFIENLNKTTALNLNPDTLEFDGPIVKMSDAVRDSLRAKTIAAAGVDNAKSHIGVYYIPDQSFSKSIICVMLRYPDNTGKIIYAEADLVTTTNGNTIEITNGTITSTRINHRNNISDVGREDMIRFPSVCVGKFNGFNYLSVQTPGYFVVPADQREYTMLAKIKNGTIQSFRFDEAYYLNTYGIIGGILPGVGFGFYNNSVNDYQTKAVFQLYGTTEKQMDDMITYSGNAIKQVVVISQEVPEGFDVYFTQELPIFLGGLYYKLPVQTIDLRDIKENPANTVFYVYVSMNRNTKIASYVISETMLDESLTQTYIGRIITSDMGIDTIESEKVTRFLTYRPSTTKRGSAIPASTGVPSGTGSRWK